jgi:hypothetical protein
VCVCVRKKKKKTREKVPESSIGRKKCIKEAEGGEGRHGVDLFMKPLDAHRFLFLCVVMAFSLLSFSLRRSEMFKVDLKIY